MYTLDPPREKDLGNEIGVVSVTPSSGRQERMSMRTRGKKREKEEGNYRIEHKKKGGWLFRINRPRWGKKRKGERPSRETSFVLQRKKRK